MQDFSAHMHIRNKKIFKYTLTASLLTNKLHKSIRLEALSDKLIVNIKWLVLKTDSRLQKQLEKTKMPQF